jgi:hypothetical protein
MEKKRKKREEKRMFIKINFFFDLACKLGRNFRPSLQGKQSEFAGGKKKF